MPIWDSYIDEADQVVFAAAGYGHPMGYGKQPAVLVIDVNYSFVGHEPLPILESIETWRTSCGEAGWQAVRSIAVLLEHARKVNVPVIYATGAERRLGTTDKGLWRSSRGSEVTKVPGYPGNAIVAEIKPEPTDFVIYKRRPSIFFETDLPSLLKDLRVDSLLVAGGTTSGCVRASVVDAFNLNYIVSVVEECTFDRGNVSHAVSLFDMNAKYADVVSLDSAVAHLGDINSDVVSVGNA